MKKVPTVRFKGFTDDWEQRKFSELYRKSSEKNDGSIGMNKNITVATMKYKENVKVSTKEYLKTYYTFKIGDIAFEGHQSKEFKFGRFVENDIGDGIVSHIFSVFRPITDYDLHFWKYAINNEALMQRILSRCTKASTMMHDLVLEDFLREHFMVPSLKEQKQIGTYLNNLDNLITLHQRKLDQLQTLKNYCLQNMFPAKGEKAPAIRLKGFMDDWKQHKLGELLTFRNGFNGNSQQYGSGIPLISVMDILNNNFIFSDLIRSKAALNETEIKRYAVHYGDVLFQRSSETAEDAGTSNVYLDSQNIAVFGGFVICGRKIGDYDPVFLKYLLDSNKIRRQIVIRAQGAQHVNVSQDTLKDISIDLPSMSEQKMIGAHLYNLDNLITLQQRKLDQLQSLKKFMLQNLFI